MRICVNFYQNCDFNDTLSASPGERTSREGTEVTSDKGEVIWMCPDTRTQLHQPPLSTCDIYVVLTPTVRIYYVILGITFLPSMSISVRKRSFGWRQGVSPKWRFVK